MPTIKTIIILISLYGIASTITYITYIIKYNNLKKNCNTNNTHLCIETNKTTNIPYLNNINDSISDNNISDNNISDNNISDIVSKYDIYYDSDLYNKYELIDEYLDKIIIYSKDINKCYLECNNNINCYGFTKFHNYCFLKGKYDLNKKTNASKMVLVLNPNK
jgi:hypothetical protein